MIHNTSPMTEPITEPVSGPTAAETSAAASAPDIEVHVLNATPTTLSVNASVRGAFLSGGIANFSLNGQGDLVCELIQVDEPCRRRGMASAMFDFAQAHFNRAMVASRELTDDSVAFLTARGIAIPADAVIKTYDEWFDMDWREDGETEDN